MSQYKGNTTSFKPSYTVNGEEKTPINVVSTSMEVNGQLVEGYQSTYANGTSKWTPHVLTDTFLTDSHGTDNSTFTGSRQDDGTWKWEPTSDANVAKLAKNYRGPDNEKITTDQIENTFYDRKSPTTQQKLSENQANALIADKGKETIVNDKRYENLQGIQGDSTSDISQTSESGAVETAEESTGFVGSNTIEATKTRTEYSNYYYPQDISSNKQDRIIFKMRQSTGQVINPTDVKANIGSRQRKTGSIGGSVTLPIPAGIKDLNSVSWQGSKMNPLQAFAASTILRTGQAAAEGENPLDALGGAVGDAAKTVRDNKGVQKAISTLIAQQGAQTRNLLSRASGAIANPNLELLFDAPALRAFDFTFQMSPRDADEAKQIRNIINFFKQGMSVKTTSTNIFLKAPNYFEIDYVTFNDSGEMMKHPSINIIKTCALLSCAVDYTPNNSYMTYSDQNRSMVSYSLNLQFNELDPIYESDYYEGLAMQDNTNVQEIGF